MATSGPIMTTNHLKTGVEAISEMSWISDISQTMENAQHNTGIKKINAIAEDGCFLGYNTVQSGTSLSTFQRHLLPPSSGR
jgi:hypothetical protein